MTLGEKQAQRCLVLGPVLVRVFLRIGLFLGQVLLGSLLTPIYKRAGVY